MRRKKYDDDFDDDEENEFDVDEPEEIQNNGSDDDWTPESENSQGRRQSSRLRSLTVHRQSIIDASSSDDGSADEDSDSVRKRKSKSKPAAGGGRRGRPPTKKLKPSSPAPAATPSTNSEKTSSDVENSNSNSSTNAATTGDSPTTTGTTTTAESGSPTVKASKDFTSGAFVVLKNDFINSATDPPIWKIDGKALLQKYVPFVQDGKTLYKNTSVYSGWTINNKDSYYPITVIFKQQSRKEHVVEFQRDLVKVDETVTSD